MVETSRYRNNVGLILLNRDHRVFWGKRTDNGAWQFPQGGLEPNESVTEAMYRELAEEVGLTSKDVTVLAHCPHWFKYEFPPNYRPSRLGNYIGQQQQWFLLSLLGPESHIQLMNSYQEEQEFERFEWVDYWYPLQQVVPFKRKVYQNVLEYFAQYVLTPEN